MCSFTSVKNGNHVLFREFSYIKATPHNRETFIHIFWKCFRQIGKNGGKQKKMCYLSIFIDTFLQLFALLSVQWSKTAVSFCRSVGNVRIQLTFTAVMSWLSHWDGTKHSQVISYLLFDELSLLSHWYLNF